MFSNIKITSSKETKEYLKIECNKVNNKIHFFIDDMEHLLDLNNDTFIRENNEYSFFLNIKNKECELTLKKEHYFLNIEVEYANLLKNKNSIHLAYQLESEEDPVELVIELGE